MVWVDWGGVLTYLSYWSWRMKFWVSIHNTILSSLISKEAKNAPLLKLQVLQYKTRDGLMHVPRAQGQRGAQTSCVWALSAPRLQSWTRNRRVTPKQPTYHQPPYRNEKSEGRNHQPHSHPNPCWTRNQNAQGPLDMAVHRTQPRQNPSHHLFICVLLDLCWFEYCIKGGKRHGLSWIHFSHLKNMQF